MIHELGLGGDKADGKIKTPVSRRPSKLLLYCPVSKMFLKKETHSLTDIEVKVTF